jgi:hypothetical protein
MKNYNRIISASLIVLMGFALLVFSINSRAQGFTNIPVSSGGSSTLATLTDVSISGPVTGQVLTYDSASAFWYNAATGNIFDQNLNTTDNVTFNSATIPTLNGDTEVTGTLYVNGISGLNLASSLGDVNITSQSASQVLLSIGSNWINGTIEQALGYVPLSNNFSISDANDVTISSVAIDDTLRFDGTQWKNVPSTVLVGAGAQAFYLEDIASDIGGYGTLATMPSSTNEFTDTSSTINSSSVFMESYASASTGLRGTIIEGGVWEFNFWASVSTTNNTNFLDYHVFKRTALGVETRLFICSSISINSSTISNVSNSCVQPSFAIDNPTDRLVVKVYARTTGGSNRTITYTHSGQNRYSHIVTPIQVSHNFLKGLNVSPYFHSNQEILTTSNVTFNSATLADIKATLIRPVTDGTTAVTIKNVANDTYIAAFDTSNARMGIGTSAGSYKIKTYDASDVGVLIQSTKTGGTTDSLTLSNLNSGSGNEGVRQIFNFASKDIAYIQAKVSSAPNDPFFSIFVAPNFTGTNPTENVRFNWNKRTDFYGPIYTQGSATSYISGNLLVDGQEVSSHQSASTYDSASIQIGFDAGNSISVDLGGSTSNNSTTSTITFSQQLAGGSYIIDITASSASRTVTVPQCTFPSSATEEQKSITGPNDSAMLLTLFYNGSTFRCNLGKDYR